MNVRQDNIANANQSGASLQVDEDLVGAERVLSFRLGREHYGVPIVVVREIIGLVDITPLPGAPEYFRGVLNLRGKSIPIIDLRTKLGLPAAEPTERSCIIVLDADTTSGEGQARKGIIVDSVSEVIDIDLNRFERVSDLGCCIHPHYILGIAQVEDWLLILLQITSVLADAELSLLEGALCDPNTQLAETSR